MEMGSFKHFFISVLAVGAFLAPSMGNALSPEEGKMVSSETPRELKDIGIFEKLGSNVDRNLKFKNELGETVTLGSFYDGTRPVVISPVYFACPGLCNFHLNGVIDSLKTIQWSAGDQFQYLAISFDPKETPDLALKKKAAYMKSYGRPGSENGWHFLTGDAETIRQLTEQLGFKYKWNEESKEWAHASAAIVTTPQGKISRYLMGILIEGQTFKLALNEAANGHIGTLVDRMIWYCFHYDPHQSKYTLYAANVMKAGAVLVVLMLAGLVLPVWVRSRREQT